MQANDGAGLSANSFLSLNGGVLQSNGRRQLHPHPWHLGQPFQLTNSGGGFSANGGMLTINIGGNATPSMVQWGSAVGSQIVGTLQLGSASANNETLFQNGIDLNGSNRTINVTTGSGGDSDVILGMIGNTAGSVAGLTKTGNGTLTLSAANTYNGGTTVSGGVLLLTGTGAYSGTTTVTSGVLQANDGIGLPTGSLLSLSGGVLQSNGSANFTALLGATFQFTASGGGFSANGGTMTVNIGGNATPSTVPWGSTVGSQIVGTLQLGSASANNETLFQNGIDLNGSNRTINVTAGAGGDSNVISGVISTTTGTAGLTKSGNGILTLSGANTYNGVTTVSAGMLSTNLLTNEGGSGGTASGIGASGNAASNLMLANGTTFQYTGPLTNTDRLFTISGTAAGNGATLDASGSGPINYTNTGGIAYGTTNQTRTLTLLGSNTGGNTLAATIANNGTGATSVIKSGVGTWVLSGSNSYTGATDHYRCWRVSTDRGLTGQYRRGHR